MIAFLSALAVLGGPLPPFPPYRRIETIVLSRDGTVGTYKNGSTLVVTAGRTIAAWDLATVRREWSVQLPSGARANEVVFSGSHVVAFEPSQTQYAKGKDLPPSPSHLTVLDAKIGRIQWTLSGTSQLSGLSVIGVNAFVSLHPGKVAAVDVASHKVKWETPLPGEDPRGGYQPGVIGAANGTVITNWGKFVTGFNAQNGKVVWKMPGPESGNFSGWVGAVAGIARIPTGKGTAGVQVRTGKVVWRTADSPLWMGGTFAGLLISQDSEKVRAINPKTGKEVWSATVGNPNEYATTQPPRVVGNYLAASSTKLAILVDASGKVVWNWPIETAPPPMLFASGSRMICFDETNLYVYEHGTRATPTDTAGRRALAVRLSAHFDELDGEDERILAGLGADAFEPVLEAFIRTCAKYDLVANSMGGNSYPLYSKYHSLGKILDKLVDAQRVPALLKALASVKGNGCAKPELLQLVGQYGDPRIVTAYFLKELENSKTPGFEMYESNTFVARQYIEASSDPSAIAFMIKELKDPKADATVREAGYWHLAGTGGDAGLKAVLAERHKRTLLSPFEERVVADINAPRPKARNNILHEKTDAQGRMWGLVECGMLGNWQDLWLAEKVNGRWIHPLFTGVSLSGISRWVKNPPPEPTIGGKTAKQLEAGAWFDVLVNNQELRRNTAGGAYTDLEKKRLGLDITKKDTDGDGDPDDVDPWPNAAVRPLTDAEALLAAVFEARYHFDESEGVGLFSAPWNMKPFEMVGRQGPTIWASNDHTEWTLPLEQCYEYGVAFIGFNGGRNTKNPGPDDVIQWNPDHTEGTVTISTYFGGLSGDGYTATVRKFGNDWVVVSMGMAYVS